MISERGKIMLESTQTKLIDTLERIARAIEGSDAKRAEAWEKA